MKLSSLSGPLHALWDKIELAHPLAVVLVFACAASLGSETITLRTWYPSPYGSYKRVKITESLTAGTSDAPMSVNGNIIHNGNFVLKPQNCAAIAHSSEGQLCIDSSAANILKVFRSGKWTAVSGGGDSLVSSVNKSVVWPSDGNRSHTFSVGGIPASADYAKVRIAGNLIGLNGDNGSYVTTVEAYVDLNSGRSSGVFMRSSGCNQAGSQYSSIYSWDNTKLGEPITKFNADSQIGTFLDGYENATITLAKNASAFNFTLPTHKLTAYTTIFTFVIDFYSRA